MKEVAVEPMEASRSRWGAEVVRRAEEVAVGLIEASRSRRDISTEHESDGRRCRADGGFEVTAGR